MKKISAKQISDLTLAKKLTQSDWPEQMKELLSTKPKPNVLVKVLGAPSVIQHPKWPDVMKFLFSIQPTFEEAAEQYYGHRVSRAMDEGPLVQGWDDGSPEIKAILKIIAKPEAIAHPKWEEVFRAFLTRCREMSFEPSSNIINDVFDKPHIHESQKWKSIAGIFEKSIRDGGVNFEWNDFKTWLKEKHSKKPAEVRTLKKLYGWSTDYLVKHGIKSLDFRSERLFNGVPPEVYQYAPLERLTFHKVALKEISKDIGRLKNLRELTILDCSIDTLPDEIGSLKKLRKLWISDTKIESIPSSIGNLKKLTHLILGGNKLTAVPETIGSLTLLEMLSISNNPIREVPKSIGQLKSLKDLFVQKTLLPKKEFPRLRKLLPKCKVTVNGR
jgi:hypothetical protein